MHVQADKCVNEARDWTRQAMGARTPWERARHGSAPPARDNAAANATTTAKRRTGRHMCFPSLTAAKAAHH